MKFSPICWPRMPCNHAMNLKSLRISMRNSNTWVSPHGPSLFTAACETLLGVYNPPRFWRSALASAIGRLGSSTNLSVQIHDPQP